ncbi:phage tail length tape measure family protein [Stenotrophomonas maltophilia]|uniref:phage tail length tape measure family protein n=2 Tax=Stenotrophomonas maltophilia TaxID=40324 RepID=UPI0013137CBC|nr:phage tail length tape measure family protein [Stenotrophomonas maltophilia]
MASKRSLELAMRIAVDIEQAQKALPVLQRGLSSIKESGAAAGAGLDALAQKSSKAAQSIARASRSSSDSAGRIEEAGASAAKGAAGMEAAGSAAKSMSADVAAAADRVRSSGSAVQKTVADEIRMIGELDARLERGAASMADLAETETLLDRAMSRGLLSTEDYNNAIKALDKQGGALARTERQREQSVEGAIGRYDRASAKLQKLEQDERALKTAVDSGRISRDQYNRSMADLAAQRNAVKNADAISRAMGAGAVSAGQYQAAMRQLPAQITDITTSLATGMPIWMVAVQQGGQIKDSFGGIGPAARAVAAAINPMVLAVGGTAAVLGSMAYMAHRGYTELLSLESAIIANGGSSGRTAGQLSQLAGEIGGLVKDYDLARSSVEQLTRSGQLSGKALDDASRASAALATLTGDSIESTTSKISELAKSPTETLRKLNDQYGFLTVEVYEHVRALEEQGNETDAVRVAVEYMADVYTDRLKRVQDATRGLTGFVGELRQEWQAFTSELKSISNPTLEIEIAKTQQQLAALRGGAFVAPRYLNDQNRANDIAELERRLTLLKSQKQDQDELASGEAFVTELRRKGVAVADDLARSLDSGASKAEKLKKATEEVANQFRTLRAIAPESTLLKGVVFGEDGSVGGGAYDRRVKQLQSQYRETSPKAPKTDAQKDETAAQRELERLKQQIQLVGTLDEMHKRATETARIEAAIAEGEFQNATARTKQELLDKAKEKDLADQRLEAERQMLGVRDRIAQLQGNGPDAELAKTRRELNLLKQELEALGETAKAADVAKLLNLSEASARFKTLQDTYNQTMGSIALDQQRIQVELQAGLITEAQAQQSVVAIYQKKLGAIREILPEMRAIALTLKDPAVAAAVDQIEVKLQEMAQTTSLLQQSIRNTLEGSFKNLFMSLVTQTDSLSDSIANFFSSLAQGIAEFAAAQLAQAAAMRLMSLFPGSGNGGGGDGAQQMAKAATVAAAAGAAIGLGATKLETSATTLSSSGLGLVIGAQAVSKAASQMQAAAAAMAVSSAASFATGGWTGPGSKYQPAGIVHADEFVLRQEVTRQSGAKTFLSAFNRVGMAAIRGWRDGYADGGPVSLGQPMSVSQPMVRMAAAATPASQAPSIGLRMVNVVDPSLLENYLDDPGSDHVFVNKISRNSASIRQVLGG